MRNDNVSDKVSDSVNKKVNKRIINITCKDVKGDYIRGFKKKKIIKIVLLVIVIIKILGWYRV